MDISAIASETDIDLIDIETDETVHTIDLTSLPFEIADFTPRELAETWCRENSHTLAEFDPCIFER